MTDSKFEFNLNDDNFKKIVIDLLIDILASNRDIIDSINSIYEPSFSESENDLNRELVLDYLQDKYGELPGSLSDFLKGEGIDKPDV